MAAAYLRLMIAVAIVLAMGVVMLITKGQE
jgi:hypothetical protein